jgi:endogenous inhibitor of DNA gyrase (YacG/DUF329 family)
VDDSIPVIVTMKVSCAACGHEEDERYDFEMPRDEAEPGEAIEPGECPRCGVPVEIHLRRRLRVQ